MNVRDILVCSVNIEESGMSSSLLTTLSFVVPPVNLFVSNSADITRELYGFGGNFSSVCLSIVDSTKIGVGVLSLRRTVPTVIDRSANDKNLVPYL